MESFRGSMSQVLCVERTPFAIVFIERILHKFDINI